jgi:subtilisin family serine protease
VTEEVEEICFYVSDASGEPVMAEVHFWFVEEGELVKRYQTTDDLGRVTFEIPQGIAIDRIIVGSHEPGYWVLRANDAHTFERFRLARLPTQRHPGWWLKCMNVDATNPLRGEGIKIGVVDSDFQVGDGIDHVKQVRRYSALAIGSDTGSWSHGEAVCRILADREPMAADLLSVSPGAEVFFANASNRRGRVSGLEAFQAIHELVVDHRVDILNLSWGRVDEDENVAAALAVAADQGVLVIAAAGNDPQSDRVMYPARDPNCVAVSALGSQKWGRKGTMVEGDKLESIAKKERCGRLPGLGAVYGWCGGTAGSGVDVAAPGVGILVQREGRISYDFSGTSYASPMVAGVMAIALGRDKAYLDMKRTAKRSQYARETLKRLCVNTGMAKEQQGLGVPQLR